MIEQFNNKYAFLSNFYTHPVRLGTDTRLYPTVEHAFQAAKTFDENIRHTICNARTPTEAKRMGRAILIRHDWDRVRLQVMNDLLEEKFSDPTLEAKLLATGTEELVEGNNWHDNFWGVCKCHKCGNVGENMLGELLMAIRAKRREEILTLAHHTFLRLLEGTNE